MSRGYCSKIFILTVSFAVTDSILQVQELQLLGTSQALVHLHSELRSSQQCLAEHEFDSTLQLGHAQAALASSQEALARVQQRATEQEQTNAQLVQEHDHVRSREVQYLKALLDTKQQVNLSRLHLCLLPMV